MEHPVGISLLHVHRRPGHRHEGVLKAGERAMRVAIGRSGISPDKREGDGRTPAGRWRVLGLLYRPDAGPHPRTALPCRPIGRRDGWCDASGHRLYNHPVRLPFSASHERLWRDDAVYDLVLVLNHNTRPRIMGRGSAVFIHLARPGFAATEGCVALRRSDMRRLLARLTPGAEILIHA
ncbi:MULTISPECIES: L,D-transpeptidase [unclassified Xanthobacter]|uniref:L,D-transpeptidase family protein n=1 Tax=unclassified Xanthobacter TaxID=2623496 RepID=UPI001F0190FC|nr:MULTISPECIES: L,D-transpeptidase family protein [unclassified Xanthobacter]